MKPLAGIRIADFTVHNAGPFCTHLLSQLGAEVMDAMNAQRIRVVQIPAPSQIPPREPIRIDKPESGASAVPWIVGSLIVGGFGLALLGSVRRSRKEALIGEEVRFAELTAERLPKDDPKEIWWSGRMSGLRAAAAILDGSADPAELPHMLARKGAL